MQTETKNKKMVRPIPIPTLHGSESFSAIPVAMGLFFSVSLLVGLCAKHAKQLQHKYYSKSNGTKAPSPLPSAKKLIATISHKAMSSPLIHGKKSASGPKPGQDDDDDSGLWQKAIMMGERCQPPEFSGVIYYDYDGNRIPEMAKSPRHTSITPLKNFNLSMQKNENSVY